MALYQQIIFPMLRQMDAERAHDLAAAGLRSAQSNALGRALLRRIAGDVPRGPVQAFGLQFPNVLGVAAGFDKDARMARGLALLGFGHVEVGTLTPAPQQGNPRPRVFRIPERGGIINRMGFPNGGIEAALPRLRALAGRDFVLGVSLGKQKTTPLEQAADDYVNLMRRVYPLADYLAINISSPNTPGLRELQTKQYLMDLLGALKREQAQLAGGHAIAPRPLLVKVAPDLTDQDLDTILDALVASDVEGIIATNTTLSRARVEGHAVAAEAGGLSGRPLASVSTAIIRKIHARTAGKLPIVGVGGIFNADDVNKKIDAGAVLVQVYSGMVYEGPGMAGRILREL